MFDLNGVFCHRIPHCRDIVIVSTQIMQDRALNKVPMLEGSKVVLPKLGYKVF